LHIYQVKWTHMTASSIISFANQTNGYDFMGAAGVLHSMEYLILSQVHNNRPKLLNKDAPN
jgi:hypothetical protein